MNRSAVLKWLRTSAHVALFASAATFVVLLGSPRAESSLSTGSLTMVSTRADGTSGAALPSTFGADQEAISEDGKVIAFVSPIPADQLVTDPTQTGHVSDTNSASDVFVWDSRVPAPVGPIVTLVSWNKTHTGTGDGASQHPIMGPGGIGVVFESAADDLVTVPVGSSSKHLYAWVPLVNAAFPLFMVDINYQGTAGANSISHDASIAVSLLPTPGARVAFTSDATDLVDPSVHSSSGAEQVYVRTFGVPTGTEMVSVGTNGNGTISGARDPMIAADGIHVVFASGGSGLVAGVSATSGNIFERNLLTDSTTLVSQAQGSSQGTTGNQDPVVSADGSSVAWDGNDPALSPTPHNGNNHIFFRAAGGPVQMVDTSFTGITGCNQASNNPGLSLDGTDVVFESFCTDIAPPSIAENSGTNVFERRLSAVPGVPDPAPVLVSVDDAGTGTGNASSFLCPGASPPHCGASTNAGFAVNADGTAIAFFSDANDIGAPQGGVPPFSNGNVFVRYPDLPGGAKTVNLTVNAGGHNPDGISRDPVISADGGSVAFVSLADDLVTPDTNQATDVFESDVHNSFYLQPVAAIGEGSGNVTITVGRTGSLGTTDTVKVDTGDGSIPALPTLPPEITDPANSNAVAPGDYTATSKTLTFGPGVKTQSFTVPITDDSVAESPELFHVSLSAGTGAGSVPLPGPLADTYVVILDNDPAQTWAPSVTLQPAAAKVGDTVTFKTTISVDPGGLALHVSSLAAGAGTSGLDQVQFATPTPFTVAAGTSTVVTATARVIAAPGTANVHLQVAVGGTIGATNATKTTDSSAFTVDEALLANIGALPAFVTLTDQITYDLTISNLSDTPAQLTGLPAGLVPPAGTTFVSRIDGPLTVPAHGSSTWHLTVDVDDADTDGTALVQAPSGLAYGMSTIGLAARTLASPPAATIHVQAPVITVTTHDLVDHNGGTLLPGDQVDVTVTVSNTGSAASTVTLTDTLTSNLTGPAAVQVGGLACGTCTTTATSVTAPLGSIPAAGQRTLTFTATVPAAPSGTTVQAGASATFSPATTGTSPTTAKTATLTVGSLNVQGWTFTITQQPPASAQVGDTVTTKATISVDPGAQDLHVTALGQGAGTSGLDQVQLGSATPFAVTAGSTKVVTATARVIAAPGSGGVHLQLQIAGTLGATPSTQTTDTSSIVDTEALSAALAPVAATVQLSDQITYSLTLTNASDTPAQMTGLPTGLAVPAGATLVGRTNGATTVPANGSSVWTLTVSLLPADTNGTLVTETPSGIAYAMSAVGLASRLVAVTPTAVGSTVSVPAPPAPVPPGTTTTVAATTTTPTPAATTTTTGTTTGTFTPPGTGADLSLAVSAPSTAFARHQLVYRFTIANRGPAAATGVRLSTKLTSGGARLVSAEGTCLHGGHLVCTLGRIAPGGTRQVTLVLLARGPGSYTETASVAADQADPAPGDNSLTAQTAVVGIIEGTRR